MKRCLLLPLIALTLPLTAAPNPSEPALLPMPQKIEWLGEAVPMSQVRLAPPAGEGAPAMRGQILAELKHLLDSNRLTSTRSDGYPITFELGKVSAPYQAEEAYTLDATGDGTRITANTMTGLYYGLQTLKQLIVHKEDATTIAACRITDYPAFKIRGFMHDVGRNFQSLPQLRAQMDFLAAYKMNVFHWHLSDHYGWRLESKIFPGLQKDAAFGRGVGKFYTQREFREFLAYCAARGITVIPEFDSPGHSLAFRRGIGVKNMKDPRAVEAMGKLIDELCSLAPGDLMPYIHIGTDEVHHPDELVNADYLPAIHAAVHRNGREVIGWWQGMHLKGDTKQIQQTWSQSKPQAGQRHIDSRSNYVNHMEALDAPMRLFFQQPCRVPHGDAQNLGGILCYWPDIRIDEEAAILRISPVLVSMAAYSEAVWTGVAKNRPEYWAKLPAPGTPEFTAYDNFEKRLAEHRDRFHAKRPFLFVRTARLPWRLLGPVRNGELADFPSLGIKEEYKVGARVYHWAKPIRGAAIHVKHPFGFPSHLHVEKDDDTVYAFTRIHSESDRDIDAWINFNTTSTSDNRAGVAKTGNWNANPLCNIWVNKKRIPPPVWKNPGKKGVNVPLSNELYTNRPPTRIHLRKGWNTVLIKSAPSWKWSFTFIPVQWDGTTAREARDLRYSVEFPGS